MQNAKFKKDGHWQTVCAATFNKAAFQGIWLECADEACSARMNYRGARTDGKTHTPPAERFIRTHGRSAISPPHFTTWPKNLHRDGCTAWNKPDDAEHDSDPLTYRQAITDGWKIVLNLNGNLGSTLTVHVRDGRDIRDSDTGYGRFMRENKGTYATRSLSGGIAELRETLADIWRTGGPAALDRVYISHHLAIMPYRDMLVGNDHGALKKLYADLRDGKNVLGTQPDKTVGFPRIFHFVPSKKTIDESAPVYLNSRRTLCDSRYDRAAQLTRELVIVSTLDPATPAIRDRLRAEKEVTVLACPITHPYIDSAERARYRDGRAETAFLGIEWVIASEAQIASVPHSRRVTQPGQKPLPF